MDYFRSSFFSFIVLYMTYDKDCEITVDKCSSNLVLLYSTFGNINTMVGFLFIILSLWLPYIIT